MRIGGLMLGVILFLFGLLLCTFLLVLFVFAFSLGPLGQGQSFFPASLVWLLRASYSVGPLMLIGGIALVLKLGNME
jgi:hypothetical protein